MDVLPPEWDRRVPLLRKFVSQKSRQDLARAAEAPLGFGPDDTIRRHAWAVLLGATVPSTSANGLDSLDTAPGASPAPDDRIPLFPGEEYHRDEAQVVLDVRRSFLHRSVTEVPEVQAAYRKKLEYLIVHVLRGRPSLHYFQGFHDIVSVFILALPNAPLHELLALVSEFSARFLRDSMSASMDPMLRQLELVHRIVRKKDRKLARVSSAAAPLPYFCISWLLTMLSHDIPDVLLVTRLFDVFLAHGPAFVLYFVAAIVLSKRPLFESASPELFQDPAAIHAVFSTLPTITIDEELRLAHIELPVDSNKRESSETDTNPRPHATISDDWLLELLNGHQPSPLSSQSLIHRAIALRDSLPLSALRAESLIHPHSSIFAWQFVQDTMHSIDQHDADFHESDSESDSEKSPSPWWLPGLPRRPFPRPKASVLRYLVTHVVYRRRLVVGALAAALVAFLLAPALRSNHALLTYR